MNAIVRRASIACPFDDLEPLIRDYADGRLVSLFGLTPVGGARMAMNATVRARLSASPCGARCRVSWRPVNAATALPPMFAGDVWAEPDGQDPSRSWLVLDGEYTGESRDPLVAIIARRLTGALARDLLARLGDYVEARVREATASQG